MPQVIADRNRLEIRQSIGYNLNDIIVSEVTATVDNASLQDTYGLAKGGDNEYAGRQVQINTPAGSIVSGEKSFVTSHDAGTFDCTMAPVFSDAITDGDTYEMWKTFTIEEINDQINQTLMDVTNDALQLKETHDTFTLSTKYEYDCLTGFEALHTVEYVSAIGTEKKIHNCETAWDELTDTDVTATADTTYNTEGDACLKLVVAAGCGAGDILATDDISSTDLSKCDQLEVTIRSSTALDAGDIQVLLDNTASCASVLEALDIPATSANTTTRHTISLANPHSDTAIISVGLKMVTDKGAFTLYADHIKGVLSTSKIYKTLHPDYLSIVKGSTTYLKLTPDGLGITGNPTQLRLSGYQIPALLTDDTTDSKVDPAYLIAQVTGHLLIGHAKSRNLDIHDRQGLAKYWLGRAEVLKRQLRTSMKPNTRWVV